LVQVATCINRETGQSPVRSRRRDSNTIEAAKSCSHWATGKANRDSFASAGRPACIENTYQLHGDGGCCTICSFTPI